MNQAGTGKAPREIFVGRVEEQKQFRAALRETLKPPRGETLPYVLLLYGDGGIGKTTLARCFRSIAMEERPFARKVKCLWVDWEAERKRTAALRVGGEYITAEAVFDTIYTVAQRAGWGNQFDAYRQALKKRQEAEKQANQTLRAGEERDEWAAVRGASAAAIAAYQQAIAVDEKYASPWNGLGNVYRDQGQPEEAIAAFQQAIALDEKYAYPWNGLGKVYRDQGRHEEAIAAYQQAIALDEKYAYPWNGLGIVYRNQGRHEEAIAAFQQAVALDEKHATPWNSLGLVYRDQGRPEEAIAAFQRAIALDENSTSPWNSLGNLYTQQGELTLALEAFRRAAVLAPERGLNQACLAGILRRLGRQDEATEQEHLARPLMAQENEYNRACFEAVCGNAEEALRLLQVAMEKRQTSREWAAQDPDLESLHGDPRFARLVGGTDGD